MSLDSRGSNSGAKAKHQQHALFCIITENLRPDRNSLPLSAKLFPFFLMSFNGRQDAPAQPESGYLSRTPPKQPASSSATFG
jgi:hypothetical protein